ncbi:MAG: hypothetical protein R3F24_15040 [Gammaproteobacteria bacterium]
MLQHIELPGYGWAQVAPDVDERYALAANVWTGVATHRPEGRKAPAADGHGIHGSFPVFGRAGRVPGMRPAGCHHSWPKVIRRYASTVEASAVLKVGSPPLGGMATGDWISNTVENATL